jgi:hypothetical protein
MELRRDFMDSAHWNTLAKARDIRLPRWDQEASGSNIREWMIKLNMTHSQFVDWMGYEPADFQPHNPLWPLRAWVGLALEFQQEALVA